MRERLRIFDIIQLRCRDGRLESGVYESLNGFVNINGLPKPPRMEDIPGFPHRTYEEIYKDTEDRRNELRRDFRLAVLRGCQFY